MGTLFKRQGSPNWYGQFVDHTGARIVPRSTRTADKAAAKRILAKWEADAALRREGVIDPAADRLSQQSQRSLTVHLREFRKSIEAPGRSVQHVDDTMSAIDEISKASGWDMLTSITAESVESHMATMRKRDSSNRTIQRKVSAAKQFSRWAHRTGRIASDPLVGVRTPSPDADRRHERRALHPDEWPWLRDATSSAPQHHHNVNTGRERALLYEFIIQTGLRSWEVRQLTRGKLHLDRTPPFALIPSRSTKNKKPARQYITADLCCRLGEHIRELPAGEPVFRLPEPTAVAAMARRDLARARELWIQAADTDEVKSQREASDFLTAVDHEGHRYDFHALRHTCGAWLAMNGENPKTIQSIMRHSSITLTMDTYGHLFPASESDAIARLGSHQLSPTPLLADL